MRRVKIVTILLAALLAALASTATLAANEDAAAAELPAAPSVADADCLTWRVSYANAIDGRRASVDFTSYETARRHRDGLCGRTPFPIFVDIEGPACLRVHVREDHAAYTRPDGLLVAPQWSVAIGPWDPARFGGTGGNVFFLWQGFQGSDAERHALALARRITADLRALGYTVADPGPPGAATAVTPG